MPCGEFIIVTTSVCPLRLGRADERVPRQRRVAGLHAERAVVVEEQLVLVRDLVRALVADVREGRVLRRRVLREVLPGPAPPARTGPGRRRWSTARRRPGRSGRSRACPARRDLGRRVHPLDRRGYAALVVGAQCVHGVVPGGQEHALEQQVDRVAQARVDADLAADRCRRRRPYRPPVGLLQPGQQDQRGERLERAGRPELACGALAASTWPVSTSATTYADAWTAGGAAPLATTVGFAVSRSPPTGPCGAWPAAVAVRGPATTSAVVAQAVRSKRIAGTLVGRMVQKSQEGLIALSGTVGGPRVADAGCSGRE